VLGGRCWRLRVDDASRESEARYRELVENLNDLIFSLDASGTVSYVSPVVEDVGGYRASEVTGHSFAEFVHPDDLEMASASFERTLHGTLEPLDFRLLAKDFRLTASASRTPTRLLSARLPEQIRTALAEEGQFPCPRRRLRARRPVVSLRADAAGNE
jgi:PAS domain-containing protein